jgi:hypothetical protein
MIEAYIHVDREIIVKGYKKTYGLQVLRNAASYYTMRGFFLIVVIAAIDAFFNAGNLIGLYVCVISAIAIGASVLHYFDWVRQVNAGAADYELDVALDENGVTIKNNNDYIAWSEYAYFREHDDYLELMTKKGQLSFVPKEDHLGEIVFYTKTKIPERLV